MQNQDKLLENSQDHISSRVNDLKKALTDLLMKLEHQHETLQWPSVLNSFALLSGQINTLNKHLKNDKTPSLKNLILLPLKLSQDRDEDLEKSTEGRVPSFNHEVVPNYLRTKLEPESEEREQLLAKDAAQLTPEQTKKQVETLNKLSNHLLNLIASHRDNWDTDASRLNIGTTSMAETSQLVGVVTMGRGIKTIRQHAGMPHPGGPHPGGPPVPQMGAQMQRPNEQHAPVGKMQSAIRTNIKSGGHPYHR